LLAAKAAAAASSAFSSQTTATGFEEFPWVKVWVVVLAPGTSVALDSVLIL